MFLPETKYVFGAGGGGEICLQRSCKKECCLACSRSRLASLLPGQCPSGFPPLCWESAISQEKNPRFSLLQTLQVSLPTGPEPGWSHPCKRASGWFSSCTFTGVDPNHLSHPAISPLFPRSPNQQQTICPLVFLFSRWSCCCLCKDGEGETGEVPNWGRFEMGFTTGWISWTWSPNCTSATVCTARTAAGLVHQPPHQFSLSAFTLNILISLQMAVPWWLVRPCCDLNIFLMAAS